MIYNIQTFCIYGYWADTDLKPKSHKPIIAACDRCGRIKVTSKHGYNSLCRSCSHIKYFEDNLQARENVSKQSKENWKNPVIQEKQSVAQKKRYEDPEEREKSADAANKMYDDDPTIKDRIRESLKNSESHKIAQENQVGGNDIVTHHYIYDFNDLDKYTIKITRSEHAVIHNKLRGAGLEVSCINILKED